MPFQTEYEFELPMGYVDGSGTLHKTGVMRLAKAADEILPMKDHKVQQNPAYLTIILLARVVVKLGSLDSVSTNVIENLFTSDLAYLQDFYQRINGTGSPAIKVICPNCQYSFEVETSTAGEF